MVAALVLAACGNGDSTESGGAGNGGGEIFVSGSSTVEPITNRVAEVYAEQNADFQYTVEGPGTGDGFALFCNGETDISDASRAISEEELAACEGNGISPVEIEVALDALTVIGNPASPVSCMTFGDLYALFGPESEGFATWKAPAAMNSTWSVRTGP